MANRRRNWQIHEHGGDQIQPIELAPPPRPIEQMRRELEQLALWRPANQDTVALAAWVTERNELKFWVDLWGKN